jgi:hypothetical protein
VKVDDNAVGMQSHFPPHFPRFSVVLLVCICDPWWKRNDGVISSICFGNKLNDWQYGEIVQGFGAENVLKKVEIYRVVNSSPRLDGNHFKEERIRRATYMSMLREEFDTRLF